MPNTPGKFIVFDGGEGCGKSTQARLLKDSLESRGRAVLLVRDPGTTAIGERIRAILLDPSHGEMAMRCEMLLYMAARAQMMNQMIRPALDNGMVVISDRFVSSTLAYQLGGDGLSRDEIVRVAEVATGGRWPDLTVILDMPTEGSAARVRPKFTRSPGDPDAKMEMDRIERRPTAYHEQVRGNYLEQARQMPDKYRVVNAAQSADQVHHDVLAAINPILELKAS